PSRAAGSACSTPIPANSRSWTFARSSWRAPPRRAQGQPMADLILKERLQPALLDRLADDEPEKLMESREQRVISLAKLRQCILRDLSWLLNAVRLDATQDLSEFPSAQRSVLNYGLPSFTGGSIAQLSVTETEDAIKEAILRFEPRLLSNSIKV